METLFFSCSSIRCSLWGELISKFEKIFNIFSRHRKWAGGGWHAKHNTLCLYFSPTCSIKEAYVFIVLHQGTNTWALFNPRVFILIPRGDLQYSK